MKKFRLLEKLSDYPLRQELVNRLGNRFVDENKTYSATKEDLKIMYDCINEYVFDSKLLKNPQFQIRDRTTEMAKGTVLIKLVDKTYVPEILYIREDKYDTMVLVINVLCHEMIHQYDIIYGPISKIRDKTVSARDGKQFVGDYDVHSEFFQSFIKKAERLGIPVLIYQPDKIHMRYFKEEDTKNESEKKEKISLVQAARQFYDAIKTDELFLVEVKDNEVYVVMQ